MNENRIGRRQLESVRSCLTDRDLQILESVSTNRFLASSQISRLCFSEKETQTSSLRATNRALRKLSNLRLLVALERRIGGVRAGSGAYVWSLGALGARLLQSVDRAHGLPHRLREREPSRTFLEHALAVAEVSLRLTETARRGSVTVISVEHEPDCWRICNRPGGGLLRLKPDLAVTTATDKFEDYWFFEIDMATEPPSRIVRTCLNYEVYRRSGIEQKKLGLFPAVVWIVPSAMRKETIRSRLDQERSVDSRLFWVITLDELYGLLRQGAAEGQVGASHPRSEG